MTLQSLCLQSRDDVKDLSALASCSRLQRVNLDQVRGCGHVIQTNSGWGIWLLGADGLNPQP